MNRRDKKIIKKISISSLIMKHHSVFTTTKRKHDIRHVYLEVKHFKHYSRGRHIGYDRSKQKRAYLTRISKYFAVTAEASEVDKLIRYRKLNIL